MDRLSENKERRATKNFNKNSTHKFVGPRKSMRHTVMGIPCRLLEWKDILPLLSLETDNHNWPTRVHCRIRRRQGILAQIDMQMRLNHSNSLDVS